MKLVYVARDCVRVPQWPNGLIIVASWPIAVAYILVVWRDKRRRKKVYYLLKHNALSTYL